MFVHQADSSWAELLSATREMQVAQGPSRGQQQGRCHHSVGKTPSCVWPMEEFSWGLNAKREIGVYSC